MRVVIAGGGTGGHIIPALAIANELRAAFGTNILFVGTPRGLESRLIPPAGYELSLIKVGQLKNVSLLTRARTLVDLPLSIIRCRALLSRFRPHVVIGVGGYASGPAMAAAILDHIPTLAFEPNAYPGLANRLVGKYVGAAAVNFPAAAKYFRNAQVTGIPVREEFFRLPPRQRDAPPHLLVFGGSQGARILNTLLPQIASPLLAMVPGLTILHQAGARHAKEALAAYMACGAPSSRWQVYDFLDDMPRRFASADLVLSRSGASTVAELAAAGKPSLLVPFPQAADDHQRKNAEALVDAGAARMLVEAEATKDSLLATLVALLNDRAALDAMSTRARTLAHPDAVRSIMEMVLTLKQNGVK
ncbi:MAG: undecaprenyldiphospho-muramoylpentapeptide beta-N-acetylglucosaminyltransferase [Silvibacterium sp.]|nr:undecaprenyldiphospho-muramoylpentapeptide beta-N-acetylglucosaminyltransferase [Silvibacterium sp.]